MVTLLLARLHIASLVLILLALVVNFYVYFTIKYNFYAGSPNPEAVFGLKAIHLLNPIAPKEPGFTSLQALGVAVIGTRFAWIYRYSRASKTQFE